MAAVYARFADNVVGAAWAIRLCAVLLLIIGVLCWFVIDNTNVKEQTESLKDVCVGMFKCLKIPQSLAFGGDCVYGLQCLWPDELYQYLPGDDVRHV